MTKSLFAELKQLGVDEDVASKVSASLDPDYNASKKDILVMQEAIMQVQVRSDARYHELNNKTDSSYHELNNKIEAVKGELRSEMHEGFASIRSDMGNMRADMGNMRADMVREMASMSRQYLITFGGLISTIVAVFLVNLYFHL